MKVSEVLRTLCGYDIHIDTIETCDDLEGIVEFDEDYLNYREGVDIDYVIEELLDCLESEEYDFEISRISISEDGDITVYKYEDEEEEEDEGMSREDIIKYYEEELVDQELLTFDADDVEESYEGWVEEAVDEIWDDIEDGDDLDDYIDDVANLVNDKYDYEIGSGVSYSRVYDNYFEDDLDDYDDELNGFQVRDEFDFIDDDDWRDEVPADVMDEIKNSFD